MRDKSSFPGSIFPSELGTGSSYTGSNVSVKLAKAFVQRDGSSGNSAGIVILPRTAPGSNDPEHGSRSKPGSDESLFPSDGVCLRVAKRVGLPETSFVLCSTPDLGCRRDGEKQSQRDNGRAVSPNLSRDRQKGLSGFGKNDEDDGADFQVKWYTPEQEVDMCGHATIALAGYLYTMMAKEQRLVGARCDPRDGAYFWRMKCKAGLLGIEVFEGAHNESHSGSAVYSKRGTKTDVEDTIPLLRVVMEQANPEYCGNIDLNEIAVSLGIEADTDLAVTAIDGNGENHDNSRHKSGLVFPFSHCEIVSTGGRDLMIPVRSAVLNEMDILGNDEKNNSARSSTRSLLLSENINAISRCYNLVGYHMFEVDDRLFPQNCVFNDETGASLGTKPFRDAKNYEGNNRDNGSPIHLNELIHIFQTARQEGTDGIERCLEAVLLEHPQQQVWHEDGETYDSVRDDGIGKKASSHKSVLPFVRHSRMIEVTGVRNFAPHVGIPEEPATGSANGALACYLVKHLFLGALRCGGHEDRHQNMTPLDTCNPIWFRFLFEQGKAMGEPCLVDAEIEVVGGAIGTVKVGGLARVSGDTLELDLNSL